MTGSNNQAFPQLSSQFVDETGKVSAAWYRFLISLWKKTGSGFLANVNSAYLEQSPTGAGNPVSVRRASDGSLIGTLPVINIPGGPVVPQVLGASPFVFTAPRDGSLVVESGKVELSRDHGTSWFQASLVGGAIPVLIQDQVRVTWFSVAPKVDFFPIAS